MTRYGMSFHTEPFNVAWRVSNLIQIPIGIMFIIISFWYPESPRWLLEKKDNTDRALAVLCKLRMGTPASEHIRTEFHELIAAKEARSRFDTGYKGLFKSPGMRKRLLYGLYATALQQAGGIAALTMYATLVSEPSVPVTLVLRPHRNTLIMYRSTSLSDGTVATKPSRSMAYKPLYSLSLCWSTPLQWIGSAGNRF
jgi:hypothetical protein